MCDCLENDQMPQVCEVHLYALQDLLICATGRVLHVRVGLYDKICTRNQANTQTFSKLSAEQRTWWCVGVLSANQAQKLISSYKACSAVCFNWTHHSQQVLTHWRVHELLGTRKPLCVLQPCMTC